MRFCEMMHKAQTIILAQADLEPGKMVKLYSPVSVLTFQRISKI
jgi:hypothetical protein